MQYDCTNFRETPTGYTDCRPSHGTSCTIGIANRMQILIKIIISILIILVATAIAKKLPSSAGLISVMPITGALVLVWVYLENKGDSILMQDFTKGALWGIIPSVLFFLTAMICFKKQFPLSIVLIAGFSAWLGAALLHQWLLK